MRSYIDSQTRKNGTSILQQPHHARPSVARYKDAADGYCTALRSSCIYQSMVIGLGNHTSVPGEYL